MCTSFNHLTTGNDNNHICISDGGKSVGNDNGGALLAGKKFIQRILDNQFRLRIES